MFKTVVIVIVIFILGYYLVKNITKDNSWTLMVCKTKHNEAECFDNDYVIPGFRTQKECMLEGAKSFSKQGFECGKSCKEGGYGTQICDVVCNKSGCN